MKKRNSSVCDFVFILTAKGTRLLRLWKFPLLWWCVRLKGWLDGGAVSIHYIGVA